MARGEHDHFDCNFGYASKSRCEVRLCKEFTRKRKVHLLFIADWSSLYYNWHLCRSFSDLVTILVHKTIKNSQRRKNSSLSHSFCSRSLTSRWRASRDSQVETWRHVSKDVKDINRWIPGICHSGVCRWDENWTVNWIWIPWLKCEKIKSYGIISTRSRIRHCSFAAELLSILSLVRKWLCLRYDFSSTRTFPRQEL